MNLNPGTLATAGVGTARLAVVLGLLAPAGWAAQAPQPYRIDAWQVEDGLPQSSVTTIVQTHDGYLWLGTFGGLVRFDGVQFKVFTPNNAPGLPSSRILKLFEDRQGTLWVATEEGYLVRYAGNRFQVYSPPSFGKMSGYIQGFAEAGDGKLCLITPELNLIRFAEDLTSTALTHWDLLKTNADNLAGDSLGQIWISTPEGISLWRSEHLERVLARSRLEEFGPWMLAGGHRGECWVAANGRVLKLNGSGAATDYGPYPWPKSEADCMLEDHLGQLWVGTYGAGLYRYATNGSILHLSTEDGLPGNFIRAITEDREGNFWVGTEGYGLVRMKPALFQSYGRKQGLSGDCVLSVCEGAPGEMWIGLNGDGVDRLKDDVVRHYGAAQGLTNEYIWSVFQDHAHQVWAGTWGAGLFRLEGEQFVPFANPGECSGIIVALQGDSGGGLWIGQQRGEAGIVHLQGGQPAVLKLRSRLAGSDVRAMVEDRQGKLWVGTQGDGLYCIQQEQQTHFTKADGLGNEFIRSLYADAAGVLWIGTYGGGLNRLQNGKFTSFTSKEGLFNDALGYINEDGHGNLWCGSLGGVFRVSKEELNRFAIGQTRWIQCFPYTESDGLPSRECTGGCEPSGCKTRDGRLWFPTIRGLTVVDPENVVINQLPPPVVIEEVIGEGKTRTAQTDFSNGTPGGRALLKLPPGTERLEFHYTGLSLTAPMKVQFKYKLEGLEQEWIEAGGRRTANYSHLQPGPYRFSVQACNNDGVWNERGAALDLIILPHFWQTWWFRVLCATAVILLFVAAYEIRLASERKLAKIRLRIASDLHDEVGGNLGSIALLSELISKNSPAPPEEMVEIRRIALQTIGALRDIVWFLDPASDDMSDLILRMKDTARTMLPGIPFEFESEGEPSSATPSLHFRRNVFPMFKEILHNIAKHARAGRVLIRVTVTPRQFQLWVSDDGVGFDEKKVRGGNGLRNLRRRAVEVRGRVEINSQPGRGTRVTVIASIT